MAVPVSASADPPQPCIDALQICEIVDGRKRETVISDEKLTGSSSVELKGHIAGITLICPTADVRLELSDDRFVTEQRVVIVRNSPAGGSGEKGSLPGISSGGAHRLTIAPKIIGDCISSREVLTLALVSRDNRVTVDLRQSTYKRVYEAPPIPTAGGHGLVFSYLGGDAEAFHKKSAVERFSALTEGIRRVERLFGAPLVDGVNIIDLKGQNNALSIKGHEEIWVYGDTFWGYRPAELRSMATHETMHIFVDRGGYAADPAIRELYADLMGIAPGSVARHTLMATGQPPRGYCAPDRPRNLFWGFINEKHFIDGMSGGHADDNVDEFCTSFLHSLLFVDGLAENLSKPIHLSGEAGPRVMSRQEREELLSRYIQALAIFHSAAGREPLPGAMELFDRALQKVRSHLAGTE